MTEPGKAPRIVHVTRNLPPLVGGMERLNWHIADGLSHHAQVHVVGPQGAAACAPAGVAVVDVPLRPLWRFLLQSAWQTTRLARRLQPQVLLAGSGLTAPAVWLAARVCAARTCVYLHGLDVAVQHRIYRLLWYPLLRRADLVIVNSRPTAALARRIGIAERNIHIIPPGVTLPGAAFDADVLEDFRRRHALGARPLLLSIGRLTRRKGLCEFVRQALPAIVAEVPEVLLLVIGDVAKDSLLAGMHTREALQAAADAAGVGGNLCFLGGVDDDELACAYQAATVHVFPVVEVAGDPEGFGMVAIEAAAHGLPTVAFAAGGVVDAVQDGVSGRLIARGDYPALAMAVLEQLQDADMGIKHTARAFAAQFSWPVFHQRLWAALATACGTSAARHPVARE